VRQFGHALDIFNRYVGGHSELFSGWSDPSSMIEV
jgi:hypothetical protein